jgi:hypothetical protein
MEKSEYLKLAEEKWSELEKLKSEKNFYEYEKRFEEIWLELGRSVLEKNISKPGNDRRKKKRMTTRFGKIEVKNTHPFSKVLHGFKLSPYLQEQSTFISQMEVYSHSSETIEKLLRVEIGTSQLHRVTDCYGSEISDEVKSDFPLEELEKGDVIYAQMDGGMIFTDGGWQEVKVGRVFRASEVVKQSENTDRQIINSSQYVAHLGSHLDFLKVLHKAVKGYKKHRKRLVFINDGAVWIDNWIKGNYPSATSILDYYHVAEKISGVAKLLLKDNEKHLNWFSEIKGLLLESKVEEVRSRILKLKANTVEEVDAKLKLLRYLNKNEKRIDYKLYRGKGLAIGSGAIEASHRTVVQSRMKKSGQRWSNYTAQNMLNLRVAFKSERWDIVVDKIKNAAA